jgi:hypothetical protein
MEHKKPYTFGDMVDHWSNSTNNDNVHQAQRNHLSNGKNWFWEWIENDKIVPSKSMVTPKSRYTRAITGCVISAIRDSITVGSVTGLLLLSMRRGSLLRNIHPLGPWFVVLTSMVSTGMISTEHRISSMYHEASKIRADEYRVTSHAQASHNDSWLDSIRRYRYGVTGAAILGASAYTLASMLRKGSLFNGSQWIQSALVVQGVSITSLLLLDCNYQTRIHRV